MSNSGIYPALSGAVAESQNLDLLANNLANVATTSFRGQRLDFREVLSRAQINKGRAEQRFVQVGLTSTDSTPGPLRHTGAPTDVALAGPGFLAVRDGNGESYLRGGSLVAGGDGRLMTLNGYPVLGAGGAEVTVAPGTNPAIGPAGEVMIDGQAVAQLKVVEFPDPRALTRKGNGLFVAPRTGPAPSAATQTRVVAESLEAANVSPLRTMTEVITTQRHYEALHRVIETFKEVDSAAAHDIASVA